MAKADVFVSPPDIKDRFAKYMGDKPVLFNLYEFAPPILKKKNTGLSPADLEKFNESVQALVWVRHKAFVYISSDY